jgi:eukaryotic-like serine/threonine-protein kinase
MTSEDETAKSPSPPGEASPASKPPPSSRKSDRPSMRPGGPDSLVGRTLSGRYRIDKVIGEGGMGVVYAAEHLHMHKRLAIKILHPEMSRLPEVVERFGREAMAAAHIDHPNVAAATDFGKLDDGSFFLVLEYIEGHSLREVIARGRLEVPRAMHIMEQVALALGRASVIGIVHRDLKPENIMLIQKDGDPDFVKVLDFGIAKVPVAELGALEAAHDPARPVLTQLGMVYGTPEYMAPEQALGQAVDSRADLYALGVMTFEMLTGTRPFDHESKVTLLGMQVTAPVPKMAQLAPDADIPPAIEAIVARLLAKEASNRFADARELLDAASLALGGPPTGPTTGPRRGPSASRVSLPGAVALTAAEAAGTAEPPPSRVSAINSRLARVPAKTWAIVAASVGAVAFLVSFVVAVTGGSTSHIAVAADAQPTQLTESNEAGVKMAGGALVDQDLAAARQALARGDAQGALKLLVPIAQANPGRGDIHHAMEQAYAHEHDTKNMIEQARLWLLTDPKGAADQDLAEALRAAALGKEDADAALAMLEGRMGSLGVDVLYDLAYGQKTATPAGARAKQALQSADVRSHASDAALVLLDLHAASTCEGKRAVLARAKESGDARALPLLTPLTYTQGCGFLRAHDCWPCLHRDSAVKDAIAAITARGSAAP